MFDCPVQETSRREGALPALETPGNVYSYAELNARIDAAVRFLRHSPELSLRGPLALQPAATLASVCFLLAGWRLGRYVFLAHSRWPVQSAQRVSAGMGCRTLFVDRSASSVHASIRSFAVFKNVFPDQESDAKFPSSGSAQQRSAGVILMTSGSSGSPKAACLSCDNLVYNAKGSQEVIPVQPLTRWLLSLPLYHVGGLGILLRCFLAGGTVVLPGPASSLEQQLIEQDISHVSLVPTQLLRIMDTLSAGREQLRLKAVLLGGAAAPPALIRQVRDCRLPLLVSYGLTEMGSQVATSSLETAVAADGKLRARVLKYREVSVARDGEILVKGETLFQGYCRGRTLIREVDAEGWFATGDLGTVDGDGYLHVQGRKDSMFISGGENIQPEEVEAALLQSGLLAQALVVGQDHEEYGQVPVAFIAPLKPADPGTLAEELRRTLAASLPKYKIPVAFFPLLEDDRSGNMKLLRRYYQERLKNKNISRRKI